MNMLSGKVYYSIDHTGVLTWISRNITDLAGWSQDEAIGKHFAVFIAPQDHEEIYRKRANRQAGKIDEYNTYLIHKDGEYIPIRIEVLQTPENSVGAIDRRLEERHIERG